MRENIIDAVRFMPTTGKFKVYIIDEVHMLSTSAFNALLKTIEEPPAHVIFILATTELHKIPETIISRCMRFDFKRLDAEQIRSRLKYILEQEKVEADGDVLNTIIRVSEGCLRDAESLLGQLLALGEKKITSYIADLVLPMTDLNAAMQILKSGISCNTKLVISELEQYVQQGAAVKHLHNLLIDLTRDALFLALGGPKNDLLDSETAEGLNEIAQAGSDRLHALLDALLDAKMKPRHDSIPQLALELAFLGLCESTQAHETASVKTEEYSAPETVNKEVDSDRKPEVMEEESVDEVKDSNESVSEEKAETEDEKSDSEVLPIDIADLQSKWGRCVEAVGKRSISLPLVLHSAKPQSIVDGIVMVGFEHSFHFDTMSQMKNLDMLAEGINEIMRSDIKVKPILIENDADASAKSIASAFGGKIVD